MKRFLSLIGLSLFCAAAVHAQCVPDSLVPRVPGVYPRILPDATGCQPYELDVTFFLPRDTTIQFFPGQTITLPFNYFRIDSVAGLPDGLTWVCNQQPTCTYNVAPGNPTPDTLGCIHISGTPTVAAAYVVVVYISAHLDLTGESQGTYLVPLRVRPCVFEGDCYAYSLESVCEPTTLKTENKIPSLGASGYSYRWTFAGPGGPFYTTSDEQPLDLPLPVAGAYAIDYEARIDTANWILEDALIEAIGCSDLFDGADLFWRLKDSRDSTWFSTASTPATNAGASLPYLTQLPDQSLPTGWYKFEVFDRDPFNDEPCGPSGNSAVYFTIPPASDTLTVSNGPLTVTLYFFHPVSVIGCRDTFEVAALPPAPTLTPAPGDTLAICPGASVTLVAAGADSLNWFRNGRLLPGIHGAMYQATEPGFYQAEAIDAVTFCRQASLEAEVTVLAVPTPDIRLDAGQVFRIVNPLLGLSYRWYDEDGDLVATGPSFKPGSAGNYYARAFDPSLGCESLPTPVVGMVPAAIQGDAGIARLAVFPNPFSRGFQVDWEADYTARISLSLLDASGRTVWQDEADQYPGPNLREVELPVLPSGLYFFVFQTPQGRFSQLLSRQ